MLNNPKNKKKIKLKLNFFDSLSKPALKGLIIAASTVAVVELLKKDYSVGISASISWLLLIIASKRIFKWNTYHLYVFSKNI